MTFSTRIMTYSDQFVRSYILWLRSFVSACVGAVGWGVRVGGGNGDDQVYSSSLVVYSMADDTILKADPVAYEITYLILSLPGERLYSVLGIYSRPHAAPSSDSEAVWRIHKLYSSHRYQLDNCLFTIKGHICGILHPTMAIITPFHFIQPLPV